jgi:biotin operon repressor
MTRIRRHYTAQQIAKITALYQRGKTYGQIAAALDKSKSAIWHCVKVLIASGELIERSKLPYAPKAPPAPKPIKIGTFEEPLGPDERQDAFVAALRASENLPANAAVRESRAVVARLSVALSVSCVGSAALLCSEN